MITSQEVSEIFSAMCNVKKSFKTLIKNKQGYGYKYTTLDNVIELLNEVLPDYGLGFIQTLTTQNNVASITTRVIHTSGQYIEDTVELTETDINGKVTDTQKMGASITYFRRYCLSTTFGIASDEDTDGVAREHHSRQQSQPIQTNNDLKPKQSISTQQANSDINNNNSMSVKLLKTGNDEVDKKLCEYQKEEINGSLIFNETIINYLNGVIKDTILTGKKSSDDLLSIAQKCYEKRSKQLTNN